MGERIGFEGGWRFKLPPSPNELGKDKMMISETDACEGLGNGHMRVNVCARGAWHMYAPYKGMPELSPYDESIKFKLELFTGNIKTDQAEK